MRARGTYRREEKRRSQGIWSFSLRQKQLDWLLAYTVPQPLLMLCIWSEFSISDSLISSSICLNGSSALLNIPSAHNDLLFVSYQLMNTICACESWVVHARTRRWKCNKKERGGRDGMRDPLSQWCVAGFEGKHMLGLMIIKLEILSLEMYHLSLGRVGN